MSYRVGTIRCHTHQAKDCQGKCDMETGLVNGCSCWGQANKSDICVQLLVANGDAGVLPVFQFTFKGRK